MVNYARFQKSDLRQFAKSRGLRVQSSGKRAKIPLKCDLVRALQDQDDNSTFRFLYLPPELRNMVYRELLVIKGTSSARYAPKCHPQILLTSKEVHQEARSILYGDNDIEIKVYASGVYAHGMRCGIYQSHGGNQPRSERPGNDLIWPTFLSQVWSIRMTIVDLQPGRANPNSPSNLGSMHKVLFSLCSVLQNNSTLRSLMVDLSCLTIRYVDLGRLDVLANALPLSIYPLRMLDKRAHVQVTGIDPVSPQQPLQPKLVAVKLAKKILSNSIRTILRQLQAALRDALLFEEQLLPLPVPEPVLLVADFISVTIAGMYLPSLVGGSALMRQQLRTELQILRDIWDRAAVEVVPGLLAKQFEGLLMLGVEIEREEAESQAGR